MSGMRRTHLVETTSGARDGAFTLVNAVARAHALVPTVTLAALILPLGLCAYAAAFASLPLRLALALGREVNGRRGTDVRELARGLVAMAVSPSLVGAISAEIRDDAAVIKEMSASARARVDEYRAASEAERAKFQAACARLKEEELVRERLREQLAATRDELKRERAVNIARGAVSKSDDGAAQIWFSVALLGIALLYFHDIPTVHVLDKKIAAAVPAIWMACMSVPSRALRAACVGGNLVLAGYFARIVLEHARALGAESHVVQ